MGGGTAWTCRPPVATTLHLYVAEAKKERAVGLPKPTLATVFEVVTDGKVYRVKGEALQKWIVERREKWQGPKGYMFTKRPGLA
jgi:hypothetical protein